MAASDRLQKLIAELQSLTPEEREVLSTELVVADPEAGKLWGEEIERRAQQVLDGRAPPPLDRTQLAAILALPIAEARMQLTKMLAHR